MTTFNFSMTDAGAGAGELTLTLGTPETPGVNAAPTQAWFEVTNVDGATAGTPTATYDPRFHEILYIWTFDDAANSAPTTALNAPNIWKDTNKAYGRRVAHVFNDPGTYTVTCYAYEPATQKFGSKTTSVTIGDPATVFPTTQTIIYDPANGNWSTPYPGADIRTTWGGVESALTALAATDTPARVLFADDFTIGDRLVLDNWFNFRIGPAQGVTPTIFSESGSGSNRTGAPLRDQNGICRELVAYGIAFQGEWDSTKETGRIRPLIEINKDTFSGADHQMMLHRCTVDGFHEVENLSSNNSDTPMRGVVSDTHITNWSNFGTVSRGGGSLNTYFAVLGSSIAQHVDALSGGAKNGVYNQHGSWRDYGVGYAYVSASEFFARSGWSSGGQGVGIYAGYSITSDQPCIRMNTNGGADRWSYLDRVTCEGKLGYVEASLASDSVPGNHVIDKLLVVTGSRHLGGMIDVGHGGMTIRNALGIQLESDRSFSGAGMEGMIYVNSSAGAANDDAGIRAYNNTLVDLRHSAYQTNPAPLYGAQGGNDFSTKVVENNIRLAPGVTNSDTTDGPLDLSTPIAGFAPRHKGPRIGFHHEEGTFANTVSGSGEVLEVSYAEVKDTIYNRANADDGTPTTQAYWQAIESTHTDHSIMVEGSAYKYALASKNEIAVEFTDPDNIRIFNNSGSDWNAGTTWRLKLDRKSMLPDFQPEWTSVGKTVPLARPLAGSAAVDSGDAGARAHDDWCGDPRPESGNERGALLGG